MRFVAEIVELCEDRFWAKWYVEEEDDDPPTVTERIFESHAAALAWIQSHASGRPVFWES